MVKFNVSLYVANALTLLISPPKCFIEVVLIFNNFYWGGTRAAEIGPTPRRYETRNTTSYHVTTTSYYLFELLFDTNTIN